MNRFRLSVAMLLTAWSLAGSGVTFAGVDEPQGGRSEVKRVNVVKAERSKLRVYTPAGQAVAVAIIDASGNVLYQGTLRNPNARGVLFNLTTLPDGPYTLTASSDDWWVAQPLLVQGKTVQIDAQRQTEVVKPTITAYQPNKFELRMPTQPGNQLAVSIYDARQDLVFTDTFAGRTNRRFDLSHLPAGAYTFVVGSAEKQFSQRIDVR